MGNRVYRNYLIPRGPDHFVIDEDKVKEKERFAGFGS